MDHSTPSPPSDTGYTYWSCRCPDCREAHRVAVARLRKSKRQPDRDLDRDSRIRWPK